MNPTAKTPIKDKTPSKLSEYAFQPSGLKVIHTEYFKSALAQFTTIFDQNDSLPKLPMEILEEIDKVLNGKAKKLKTDKISVADFMKLQDGQWLNDEVINAYIDLIRERNKLSNKYAPMLIFNTFMFTTIQNDIQNACYSYPKYKRNWERRQKVDITKMEYVIFPVNKHNVHWLLCKANVAPTQKRLEIYDSLPSGDSSFIDELVSVVSRLLNDAFPMYGLEHDWDYVVKECPRQRNGYDCGVCMSTNIEHLARGKEPNYKGKDTGYFRRKIAVEIWQGKLMNMEDEINNKDNEEYKNGGE